MQRKAAKFIRHERILAAAKAVFAKCGFDKAKIDDIAAAASVAKGSVYWHFRDKEDLFCRVVEDVVTYDLGAALSDSPPQRSALLRLDRLLEVFLERTTAVCDEDDNLVFELWASAGTAVAGLGKSLAAAHKRWRAVILDILDDGRQSGEFNATMDSQAAASLIMATIAGVIVNSRFGEQDERARLDEIRHGLLLAVSAW